MVSGSGNPAQGSSAVKPAMLNALATDSRIEAELRKRTGGSSEYITPCQVGVNADTQTAVVYESPAASAGNGGRKGGP